MVLGLKFWGFRLDCVGVIFGLELTSLMSEFRSPGQFMVHAIRITIAAVHHIKLDEVNNKPNKHIQVVELPALWCLGLRLTSYTPCTISCVGLRGLVKLTNRDYEVLPLDQTEVLNPNPLVPCIGTPTSKPKP